MSPDDAALAGLVADVARAPRPLLALLERLAACDAAGDAASAALGAALFESIHYRLTAFADDDLPELAGRLYTRLGHADTATLLADLGRQLRPRGDPLRDAYLALRPAAGGAGDVDAKADDIAASPNAGGLLLLALEAMQGDHGRSAALFEAVWGRQRPLVEYWVYHRMAEVYLALGRPTASALLASLAIQMLPHSVASDMPHRLLLGYFRANGRLRDAAELVERRATVCPQPPLLTPAERADLLASAGHLTAWPPPAGRHDRDLIAAETRPASTWRSYGGPTRERDLPEDLPHMLRDLARAMPREAVTIAELHDAEVLVDSLAVAVFGPDGTPHPDLSLRCFPALMGRQLEAKRRLGTPVEEIEVETAVLMCDEYPGPNICHFLLDHAPRLALYARAGVDLAAATVIGPVHTTDYQRLIAPRLGLRTLLPATRRARVRVGRLFVSSNCHHLRHPGHWGAAWAMTPVRGLFDLTPRAPARRLIVSRADARGRRLANEAAVAALLAPHGFEVIVPGRLAFADQLAAFRDATHVVAPHGAALANTLFCAPGTHVLEVFHPHYGTWAYAMLGAALGLDYAAMTGRDGEFDAPEFNDPTLSRERMHPHSGRDIRADLDELRRWLKETGTC